MTTVRMTRNQAEVLLDAAAWLAADIAHGGTEPWEAYPASFGTGLEDGAVYVETLGVARAVLRALVSGDADTAIMTD